MLIASVIFQAFLSWWVLFVPFSLPWLLAGRAWCWRSALRRGLVASSAVVVFVVVKPLMARVAPFDWDARLLALDERLHGGPLWLADPGSGLAGVLDGIYWLWFFVQAGALAWACWGGQAGRRFILAWVMCWGLLGLVAAWCFSSGGPFFVAGHALAGGPSGQVQDLLLAEHAAGVLRLGGGISAMPSLHVAIAALVALAAWRVSRLAGLVLTVYAVSVQVAAVGLGWHYAIDGYAGALGAWACWWMAGSLARCDLDPRSLLGVNRHGPSESASAGPEWGVGVAAARGGGLLPDATSFQGRARPLPLADATAVGSPASSGRP